VTISPGFAPMQSHVHESDMALLPCGSGEGFAQLHSNPAPQRTPTLRLQGQAPAAGTARLCWQI